MRLWLAVLAALAVVATHFDLAAAECCWPTDPLGGTCADGSKVASMFSCCGNGACNAACCNCEGGCRSGQQAKQSKQT